MNDFSNIRVIGFDLDQTLYPKSPAVDAAIQKYIFEKIAEKKNVSIEEAETLFKNLYKNGAGLSGNQTVEALGIPNGNAVVQEALEKADIASTLSPDTKVLEFLSKLKSAYKNIDLITGSDIPESKRKLQALGIETTLFSHFITSEIASKSDGSAYKLWMNFYPEMKPEHFLYIGDRVRSDFEIPKSLNIKSILVNVAPESDIECLQLSTLYELERVLTL